MYEKIANELFCKINLKVLLMQFVQFQQYKIQFQLSVLELVLL